MSILRERMCRIRETAARFTAFTVLLGGLSCDSNAPLPDPSLVKSSDGSCPTRIEPPRDGGSVPATRIPLPARETKPEEMKPAPETPDYPQSAPGCPANMAKMDRFCIDRFEIHLIDAATKEAFPYFKTPPTGMAGLAADSAPDVFPQGYLSQKMSAFACKNAGKRLCTLEEWKRACMGASGAKFPYGNEPEAGTCNVNKRDPHILDKHFPDIPHLKRTGKQFNDPALLQDPDYLAMAGSMPSCRSEEGVFDMDGNLSEWVSDTEEMPDGTHGTFAGDAFSGHGKEGCFRKTSAHSSDYHDYSMGTRCCKDATR